MSLDERLAALREDDDTMNNTPPMSRRSSFLGSLSRRSRTAPPSARRRGCARRSDARGAAEPRRCGMYWAEVYLALVGCE